VSTRRRPLVALATALLLAACASADRPSVQGDSVALPTPLQSYGPSLSATLDELRAAVAVVGHRLDVPLAAYRPSEPASLLQAPRVVLRADLADARDGHVVVYDAADAAEAQRWAADLAAHLGSGFGQTNFAVDTQFSVAVRDDSVILTTWSSGSSSDPGSAEAFFDAVASVGSPVEVVK
jgi:hypothetical protein